MSKYVITVTKVAEIEVEADSREAAEQVARDQEADGCICFDMQFESRPVVLGEFSVSQWVRILDDENNVSVYESAGGCFGFTGCESDHYPSFNEAVEAAVQQYGLLHGEA